MLGGSTKVKSADGRYLLDQIRQPLFDTIELDENSVLNKTRKFFTDIQEKSSYQTNMRVNGQLENTVSFQCQGLAVDAQNTAPANETILAKIMEHSAIAFRVGEKFYWEGPLRFACGRLNYQSAVAGGTDVERHYTSYGVPAVAGVIFARNNPVNISSQQNFSVNWEIADLTATLGAGTTIKFVCSLKGILRRPVQ